jgi:hypothetical protein
MKLLQTLFLGLFLSFGIQKASAQVYDFKATSYSVSEKNNKGKWSDWSNFVDSTVIITLDGKKDRVVVGSSEIQLYKILSYGEKIVTKNDETIPLKCVDNDGNPCSILIVTRKNQDNRKQFYINFDDVKFVYNLN